MTEDAPDAGSVPGIDYPTSGSDPRVVDMSTADSREYLRALLIRTGAGDVTLIQPDGTRWEFVAGELTVVPPPPGPF